MKQFINDDFMLHGDVAKKLYSCVYDLPIIDYHCHLSPALIAENHRFENAYELFLSGDHYKWRQMRTNGIDEEYITGGADDYAKFEAFARTVPMLIGNPLYHWTHLELKRYFDIDETLSGESCKMIWDACNEKLAEDDYRTQALITRSNVSVICTTDDPADTLEHHAKLRGFKTKVLPTFRPDAAVEIGKATFAPYMQKNGIGSYTELVKWIVGRIAYFNGFGCRLADHALDYVPFTDGNVEEAFDAKMSGKTLTAEQRDAFRTTLLTTCAREYARLGWTMQLHIGALRDNNRRMYEKIGADAGFDSINDLCVAEKLSAFMNSLEYDGSLPKTILYNLNPKDTYVIGAMLGNFQKSPTPGKIQLGSGWWFNDTRCGMEAQMTALANLGMLSRFVGMLTDSRSFVSYPRHEYFRRIFCNLIGRWVSDGEYPEDYEALTQIACGVCYNNARDYFGF